MGSPSTPTDQTAGVPVPRSLRAAAALVAVETLLEAVVLLGHDAYTVGLRVLLLGFLSLKWIFAARVLRLSAGAAFGLFLLEGTTVVVALGATDSSALARVALGASGVTAIVLLAMSLHAFPPAPLP